MSEQRYRTGPMMGTWVLAALAALGVVGEVISGIGAYPVGATVFGLVVILVFAGFAASGLSELRGVRTDLRPDGVGVLKLPRLGLTPRRSWRVLPAGDIAALGLDHVGTRSGLWQLRVSLTAGGQVTSGAITVPRVRGQSLYDTDGYAMIEQIRRDLALPS